MNDAPNSGEAQKTRARLEKLGWLLDDSIPLPGTKFRFGLDSLIGLIPGLGDVIGVILGAGILHQGIRIGAPRPLILKMLGISVADALGGLLPMVGDLFDFAFKSNRRNAALLMEYLDTIDPPEAEPTAGSKIRALLVSAGFLGIAIGLIMLVWWVLLGR